MKIAYVFPGQGSQFPGMGHDLYKVGGVYSALMDRANHILGFNITEIMFNGSAEDLKKTEVTQPAVFIHSCAIAASHPVPDMVVGHSLGELAALTTCRAIEFEEGLKLVSIRAKAMQKCCEKHPGSMAAIIGLDKETIEHVCSETEGLVIAANYNSPAQVVISGEKESVAKACEQMKKKGAKRALELAVSGAFHTPLMEEAADELAQAINECQFKKPLCPIYQNVSATAETDPERIKYNLLKQLTSPVRWEQSVKAMLEAGANHFIEMGPGNVLQGLIRRIGGPDIVIEGIQ